MVNRPDNPAPPPGGQPDPAAGFAVTEWLSDSGGSSDVVISSRVRLARNLAGHPFVHKATRDEREAVLQTCRDWILSTKISDRIMWVDLHESPAIERNLLVERSARLLALLVAGGRERDLRGRAPDAHPPQGRPEQRPTARPNHRPLRPAARPRAPRARSAAPAR